MATTTQLTVHVMVQYVVHEVVHNMTICEPYSGRKQAGQCPRRDNMGGKAAQYESLAPCAFKAQTIPLDKGT